MAVKMSPYMMQAQNYLLELLNACLHELRQCKLPCTDVLTQELVLMSSIERLLSTYVGPNYEDCISERSKVLVQDINDIKRMLRSLEHDDGKTFSALLNVLKRNEAIFHNSSGWLFTATAQKLFDIGQKIAGEVPNKWEALNSVLKEAFETFTVHAGRPSIVVLVFVCDDGVAKQLGEVVERWIKVADHDERSDHFLPHGTVVETEITNILGVSTRKTASVVLLPLKQRYSVLRGLFYLSPAVVVMYDVDLWLVRQVEMYYTTAVDRGVAFKIYFLMYDKSAEEQRYLCAMRRERNSFEQLFKEETNLVVQKTVEAVATDEGSAITEQTIVVDMREFRSELPTHLHTKGIKLAPVILTVGDYVLSPQICIERKAVADLIGSLLHGRLYLQCQAMCSFYDRPTLLIELSDCKKTWRHLGDIYAAKLAALTLNFPTLRLLWAASPLSAAELMIDFKWKREEPDVNKAVSYGKTEVADNLKYLQSQASSIIRCLPGVSARDISPILKTSYSLRSLVSMSQMELKNTMLLGSHSGELYEFINTDFSSQNGKCPNKKLKKT
ncbi:unnamed protein product [Soboliphyme baturini]|uniref:DNA repair endonuclease XPF n=1 Tax=Soboliphyme baturini TaxID=241478 RepID=A0A183IMW0_9BILA|nr:unnamed protein product [Soboliphyme baturini]